MKSKIEKLNSKIALAYLGGGEARIKKQHEKKKLTARERINYLLDENSFEKAMVAEAGYDLIVDESEYFLLSVGAMLKNEFPFRHQVSVAKKILNEMNGTSIIADEVGLGNVSQLADMLSDLRNIGVDTTNIEQSADKFIQVWEKSQRLSK